MKKYLFALLLVLSLTFSSVQANGTWTWGVTTGSSYKLELTGLYTNAIPGNLAILLPEENKTSLIVVSNIEDNVLFYVTSSLDGTNPVEGNITMATQSIDQLSLTLTVPEGLPFFLPLETPDQSNYLEYFGELLTILAGSVSFLTTALSENLTDGSIALNATNAYTIANNVFEDNLSLEGELHLNNTSAGNNITDLLENIDLSALGLPINLDEMGLSDFLNATDFTFDVSMSLAYNTTTGALTSLDLSLAAESWIGDYANATTINDLSVRVVFAMTPFMPEINTSVVSSLLSSLSENGNNSFSGLIFLASLLILPSVTYVLRRKH